MELLESIKIAQEQLGAKHFQGLKIEYKNVEDQSVLTVIKEHNNATIIYGHKSCLFRGLTLIKERRNEDSYQVNLKKAFTTNGFMVDVSRNGVIKVEKLKEIILTQALMGQNRLLLYTEDTYELEKYPYFGYLRGGYSKEDLKMLVEYGENFGVELIPCIQTLGHLARVFRWYPMEELKDGPSTLLIDDDKAYEFIEEMIKVSRECFHSKDIHIGMDESTEIGLGRYLSKHPYTNRVELFTQHIKKVLEICQKYDFSPMIWSDMYFRLNDKDEEYYRNTPLPESTVKLVPKNVQLVYWDYYHSDKKIYDDMISYHKQTKNEIVFAGGAWRWSGFAPSIQGSFKNTIPAMQSCVENGVKNVFVTAWGDNGNECTIYSSLPVIALYSVADFFGVTDEEKVNSLLEAVTGETLKRMKLLDLPNMPDNKVLLPQYNPSKFFLYQDVLAGIFDLQVKDNFAKNYGEHAKELKLAAKESAKFGYVYNLLANLCSVLEIKVDLGVRLRKAYREGNKKVLKQIATKDIPEILKRLPVFHKSVREQWFKENRSFGYDVLDGRIGYLRSRLETTQLTIKDYLADKLERIEELEKDILPYNGFDYEICWNSWTTTVTVHNI